MSETPTPPPAPRAPKASFASRLFGYDVFISFALGGPPRGSQSYASDLARRLRERDLSVFFSEDEAPPGSPLSNTLRRALLRSRLLVVLINRGTLERPGWVQTEVETFRAQRAGRPVIPLSLDDSLRDRAVSDAAQPWLQHTEHIWLDEAPDAAQRGLATDALVTRLLTAPRRLRANTLWRALIVAVGLALAALAMLAAWQAVLAVRERDRATALRDEALSRQLAAQSSASLVGDPVRALLLATEAHAVVRTPASDSALIGALGALPLVRLQQHDAGLQALALGPTGAFALSDVRGGVLHGDLASPTLRTVVAPKEGLNLYATVQALAFAPDGRRWAHAGSSRGIVVHGSAAEQTLPDGDRIGESTPVFVLGLAFGPDGSTLASASTTGALRVHDLVRGGSRLLSNAPVDLAALAFRPDGRWIAAGGDRGFLRAVPVAAGASAPAFDTTIGDTVNALALTTSGERLFAASRAGRVEVFDARSGRRLAMQDMARHGTLERLAVSPDGHRVVTGHGSGAVLWWGWNEGNGLSFEQTLMRHGGPVRGLAFAKDGVTVVSAGEDGRLAVTLPLDRGRWSPHPRAALPARPAASAAFSTVVPEVRSPDGRWIAWAGTPTAKAPILDVDFSRLSKSELPRLTVVRASDRTPVVDGAVLPADPGERILGEPVFAADGTAIAVQVAQRLLFVDLATSTPLDAALPLPPGASLRGASAQPPGWLAAGAGTGDAFFFGTDPADWLRAACALAGRTLTPQEWRRHLGAERAYAPACRDGSVAQSSRR